MPALPHTHLFCPECCREFRAAAWRVVAGGAVTCRHCGHGFCVDLTRVSHREVLGAAQQAKAGHRRVLSRSEVPTEVLEAELIAVLRAMLAVLDEEPEATPRKLARG